MKKRAFTVSEILITLTILGIIMALTAMTSIKTDKIKEKKIETMSHTFYTSVELAINEIMFYESKGKKGIKYLSSQELMELVTKYLEGDSIALSETEKDSNSAKSGGSQKADTSTTCQEFVWKNHDNTEMVCSVIPPNITAGFHVNSECNETVTVFEYRSKGLEAREVKNTCGYIAYQPQKSTGTLGEDLFVIALGNRHLK